MVLRKISSAKEESKASEWPLAKAVVLLPCTAALMVAAAAVRQRYHCRRACKPQYSQQWSVLDLYVQYSGKFSPKKTVFSLKNENN